MLKYIGKNEALAGVPARDLTDEEVEAYGGEKMLLASGLYEKERPQPVSTSKPKISDDQGV